MIAAQPRIDQDLRARHRLAGIAQRQAQRCREVATGAVAGHQRTRRIELKRPGAQCSPDFEAIVEGRRKRMFRRQTVIDGDHQHAEGRGQFRANEVVGIQVPHHPATTM
ncbi:hypothetical protein D9M73_177650 [compost metagenome]